MREQDLGNASDGDLLRCCAISAAKVANPPDARIGGLPDLAGPGDAQLDPDLPTAKPLVEFDAIGIGHRQAPKIDRPGFASFGKPREKRGDFSEEGHWSRGLTPL